MELTLNIYNKKGKEVERVAKGETIDIMLGSIEQLMGILEIENIENNVDILKKLQSAYQEIRIILSDIFGDITEDEWKRVKLKELVPVLLLIIKFTVGEFETLPHDPKN